MARAHLDHLACVAGVHAVVLGARGEEHARAALPRGAWHIRLQAGCKDCRLGAQGRRLGCTGLQAGRRLTERTRARAVRPEARRAAQPLVRRDGGEVTLPHARLIGVAILLHPRGTRQQLVVAAHVEQRHLADDGAEERAPLAPEPLRCRDAARHQVTRDRLEVLVSLVPLLTQRSLVPARAVLAAAADVGDGLDASARKPRGTKAARVCGGEGDLEASVTVEQRGVGAVQRHVLGCEKEVGHLRAIGRRGKVLRARVPRRVEHRGQGLERLGVRARVGRARHLERSGAQEAGAVEPDIVRVVRPDGTHAHALTHRHRHATASLVAPACGSVPPEAELGTHVAARLEDERCRAVSMRLEEHRGCRPVALHHVLERGGEQSARRILPPARRLGRCPCRAEQQCGLLAEGAQGGVVGDGHPAEGRGVVCGGEAQVGRAVELLRLVEGDRAQLELVHGPAAVMVRVLLERRASPPRLDDARVARVGERRAGAVKVGSDENLVTPAEAHLALGGGRGAEASLDEGAAAQIELAHHSGVGAARREEE
eukprot:scaffold131150_cov66-Phaeocystis_antarctica.AAC.1